VFGKELNAKTFKKWTRFTSKNAETGINHFQQASECHGILEYIWLCLE
jgi:hypothetical protein